MRIDSRDGNSDLFCLFSLLLLLSFLRLIGLFRLPIKATGARTGLRNGGESERGEAAEHVREGRQNVCSLPSHHHVQRHRRPAHPCREIQQGPAAATPRLLPGAQGGSQGARGDPKRAARSPAARAAAAGWQYSARNRLPERKRRPAGHRPKPHGR